MNITKEQIDSLNAVVTVKIEKSDYNDKVEKILKDYRKNANIPGFRKGHVPMGMVKKQYGKAVLADEVNKLLQESLNKYLTEEKLDILGNPLPKEQENFSWDSDDYSFDFELGLAPEFEVDLQPKKGITHYDIQVEDSFIDQQIERIRKQYGKLISQTEITDQEDIEITGTFFNEDKKIEKSSTFSIEKLSKKAKKEFVGKKMGDQFEINTKDLFEDAHSLMHYLGVAHDDAHDLEVAVTFTVEEINKREPSELNQELFDKLFGEGSVSSEEEAREKIKENAQTQYAQQSDQQLLNSVTEYLIDNTKFDLPESFLKKWLQTAGEKQLTEQEAEEEFNKSEKGLRYQLIEGKIINEHKLNSSYDELKDFAKGYVRNQMIQYGLANPEDAQIENIVNNILQNREEVQRLSQQLTSQKLLTFYKENVKLSPKKISYDDFVKEVYKIEEK